MIFLPAHKCSGLIIVTQNPPIADKAVQMLVAYFLMAEFSSLACFDMCSSTSRRGIHKIEVRTQNSRFKKWVLSSRWAKWETLFPDSAADWNSDQRRIWKQTQKLSGRRRKGSKINRKHWKSLVGTLVDRDTQTTPRRYLSFSLFCRPNTKFVLRH